MDKLILSENGMLIFIAIVAIGFILCWSIFIHYLKEEKRQIVESIVNGGFLSILTVIMVVIAVWLLGMTGHIEEIQLQRY